MTVTWSLERNALGRLVLVTADGDRYEGVAPVRAFPISAPDEGVSLVAADGHELAWVERLDALDATTRAHLIAELSTREFMPVIERLMSVSTFATPSTWTVDTDRGSVQFVLKGEEDIRRLAGNGLLIADSHGVQYFVRDVLALDRASRRLLDRFL